MGERRCPCEGRRRIGRQARQGSRAEAFAYSIDHVLSDEPDAASEEAEEVVLRVFRDGEEYHAYAIIPVDMDPHEKVELAVIAWVLSMDMATR